MKSFEDIIKENLEEADKLPPSPPETDEQKRIRSPWRRDLNRRIIKAMKAQGDPFTQQFQIRNCTFGTIPHEMGGNVHLELNRNDTNPLLVGAPVDGINLSVLKIKFKGSTYDIQSLIRLATNCSQLVVDETKVRQSLQNCSVTPVLTVNAGDGLDGGMSEFNCTLYNKEEAINVTLVLQKDMKSDPNEYNLVTHVAQRATSRMLLMEDGGAGNSLKLNQVAEREAKKLLDAAPEVYKKVKQSGYLLVSLVCIPKSVYLATHVSRPIAGPAPIPSTFVPRPVPSSIPLPLSFKPTPLSLTLDDEVRRTLPHGMGRSELVPYYPECPTPMDLDRSTPSPEPMEGLTHLDVPPVRGLPSRHTDVRHRYRSGPPTRGGADEATSYPSASRGALRGGPHGSGPDVRSMGNLNYGLAGVGGQTSYKCDTVTLKEDYYFSHITVAAMNGHLANPAYNLEPVFELYEKMESARRAGKHDVIAELEQEINDYARRIASQIGEQLPERLSEMREKLPTMFNTEAAASQLGVFGGSTAPRLPGSEDRARLGYM